MRRALVVLALTAAALTPLLLYRPHDTDTGRPVPSGQAPGPVDSNPPTVGSGGAAGDRTINGSVVETEFGQFQVRTVFHGRTLADVQLIAEPGDRHSRRIAESAEPALRQEALRAQSADIDTVSGATTTSEAYAQSLQAAIDARGR